MSESSPHEGLCNLVTSFFGWQEDVVSNVQHDCVHYVTVLSLHPHQRFMSAPRVMSHPMSLPIPFPPATWPTTLGLVPNNPAFPTILLVGNTSIKRERVVGRQLDLKQDRLLYHYDNGFFLFPKEIRLQVYSELLFYPEPIVFVADYGPPSPPLFRSRRIRLCPALLRRNKQVHNEATPLLYSNNHFRFPDIFNSADSVHIAPFLLQIGSQANLIRHICISFPRFNDFRQRSASLHEAHIKNLELIRYTCTSITTLELSLHSDHQNGAFRNSPFADQALDLLDTRFKPILSLKGVIANFQVYSEEELDGEPMKVRDRGWTVEITKLPKKTWISDDDRVEFDNKEDYIAYNEELHDYEWQREQEREERLGGGILAQEK